MNNTDSLWPAVTAYFSLRILFLFAGLFLVGAIIQSVRRRPVLGFGKIMLLAFSFAAFGFVMGTLIGASNSPVIGAIFGPLMTFIGGICLYFFTKGDLQQLSKHFLIPVGVGVVVFSFFLLAGVEVGATSRDYREDQTKYWQMQYDRANKLYEKELNLMDSARVSEQVRNNAILNENRRPEIVGDEKAVDFDELQRKYDNL